MKKRHGHLLAGLFFANFVSAQTTITTANIGNYAPSLTGQGASGTWNINVTGAATGVYGYTGSNVIYWAWDPSAKLSAKVSGTDFGTNVPMNITGFAASETLQTICARGSSTSNQLALYTNNGADYTYIGGNTAYARIGGYNSSTGPKNLILNESGGNVGIGTISPAYKMHINGDIGVNNRVVMSSGTLYSDVNNMASMHNGGFVWSTADNSVTKMRLASNADLYLFGNQYIGTSSNQKSLQVNGDIKTRKIKVTQLGWPDYVFDSSYQLRPLDQVEQYIQTNKHLPDIPSAAQVTKEGADLGDNQALLLKKIEELTLYIIQQNKNIEMQNKEMEAMKKRMAVLEGKAK